MKLAFCLFRYFPYGGLQRDFLRIAQACYERGHEIHVYIMEWQGEPIPPFHIHILPITGLQNHTRILRFAHTLKTIFAQETYDAIISFNKMPGDVFDLYYAADVCYQERIRTSRSIFSRLSGRYHALVTAEKGIFAHGKTTEILFISPLQIPIFQKHYQTEADRCHLLPPGIAKDRIAPIHAADIKNKVRASFNLQNHKIILFVGSGFKTKGLDRAILALASLPTELKNQCKLLVVGQDHPRAFQKLARTLGVAEHVVFLGGRKDVADFFLTADLLIHPAYHENTGTVLLEAAVAGLSVLTVDHCGYAHYIRNHNLGVVLASPFSQVALNQTLARMLQSEERTVWHENGLRFAKTADIYRLAEAATDHIERVAQKKKNQRQIVSLQKVQGEIFREQKNRRTQKIILQDKTFFIKQYFGISWKEIFKNLMQLRLPIYTAENEWRALWKLEQLAIPAPKAYAFRKGGVLPTHTQSYVLMQELQEMISLETYTHQQLKLKFRDKNVLLKKIADIARTLHENGINHRDFYLCHFLLAHPVLDIQNSKLYLIDLHRAQIRKTVPKRWLIKDLSALLFSAQHIPLSKHDLFRFMKYYRRASLQTIFSTELAFWQTVYQRGYAYRDHAAAK